MAIQWGAWEYSDGNGMRVGIDASHTSVSTGSNSCTVTFVVYTENQYGYNDGQTLVISGTSAWGDVSFTNNDGGSVIRRTTKTFVHEYSETENSYGSGDARTVTLTASISDAYNGITPSKTVTIGVPRRPYGAPYAPNSPDLNRVDSDTANISWTNDVSLARPYSGIQVRGWNSVTGWGGWVNTDTSSPFAWEPLSSGRRYQAQVRAYGPAGTSGAVTTDYIQTTPTAPSSATVAKASSTSVTISWRNNQSTANGYTYSNYIEEQVNGGGWTAIATASSATTSYSRTGRSPGATYAYRVRSGTSVGGSLYSGYATTSSIKLQSPPATPTALAVTRTNDNSFSVSWTNNPTSDAPYTTLTLQRYDNVSGAWNNLAVLAGNVASFTDTKTLADRRYQWRVRANNEAGASGWAASAAWQTTPAAVAGMSIKVAAGSVVASWSNASTLGNGNGGVYSLEIRYYRDGALVTDTVSAAQGSTSYTISGTSLTSTYRVGVRVKSTVGTTLYSPWIDSATIPAAVVPNVPKPGAPNGVPHDPTRPITFTWAHSPGADGADQTAYEIQRRTTSMATGTVGAWVSLGKVVSPEATAIIPADGVTPNYREIVEWQVRTWGAHATASAWSATTQFETSATPTVTLNSPGSIVNTSRVDIDWSAGDIDGGSITEARFTLLDGSGAELETMSVAPGTWQVSLETVLQDATPYILRAAVIDDQRLWSDTVEVAFVTDFLPPAESVLTVGYADGTGAAILSLTEGTPVAGESVAPVSVNIERRSIDSGNGEPGPWVLLAGGLAPSITVVDPTASIAGDSEYRAITISATPSSATGAPVAGPLDPKYAYVSYGPQWTNVCRLWANMQVDSKTGRERTTYQFAGRSKPVVMSGEGRTRTLTVRADLDDDSSTPDEWERLSQDAQVVLYRDILGRRIFAQISDVQLERVHVGLGRISFTLTEVDYE